MDSGSKQSGSDLLEPSVPEDDKNWWETLEGHRFAGEVLQLQIRRKIMKFIGHGMKTEEEIERTFGLTNIVAEMHLALLEKAVIIEKSGDGYRSTSIGIAYLKNFEDNAPRIGKTI
jgi:hypothetical protein